MDNYLTTSQAAKLLGISGETLRKTPKEQLPYTETQGRHRRYMESDVAAFKKRGAPVPQEFIECALCALEAEGLALTEDEEAELYKDVKNGEIESSIYRILSECAEVS